MVKKYFTYVSIMKSTIYRSRVLVCLVCYSSMLVWNAILKRNFLISILLISAKENSRNKYSQTDEHGEMVKELEKDKQQTLLNIQQNLQIATTQRLEEKIQKLQKQLSDLKLSNKNMKTQLTRVNVFKVGKLNETFKNSLKHWSVTILAACFSLNLKEKLALKLFYIHTKENI